MIRFMKQIFSTLVSFSGLSASMVNVSYFTTCISLHNQPCITRHTLIDLNPDKYNQGFC